MEDEGEKSEREARDKRGHGLVEGYNFRWALYVAALQRSDGFLWLIYGAVNPVPRCWVLQLTHIHPVLLEVVQWL